MGATVTLTTAADLPGQAIDTGAVTEQARSLRSVGKALENGTSDVLSAWQRLPASYASTGADGIYAAMVPVGANGTRIATALSGAAKALDQYVSDVQPILAEIARLKQDVVDFQTTTIPSYPKKGLGTGSAAGYAVADGATVQYDSWEDDPHAVEANHQLLVRAQSLTADLLAVQQTCATAIRAAAGLGAVGAKEVAATEKALRATDFHWSAQVAVENDAEGCAGSTSRALNGIFYDGVFIDGVVGTIQSLGGFIGWDGDKDFSWDQFDRSWVGLGHLISGIATLSNPATALEAFGVEAAPGTPDWLRDWNRDSIGAVLGLTGMVGISLPTKWWDPNAWAKNDPTAAWEKDGWATLGSSGFNVLSFVAGGAGAIAKAGAVGKLADGVRLADAATDGSLAALKGLTADELRVAVRGLSAADAEKLAAELAKPGLDPAAIAQLHLDDLRIHLPEQVPGDAAHDAPAAPHDEAPVAPHADAPAEAPALPHAELRGPVDTYQSGDAAHPGLPAHSSPAIGSHGGGPGEWVLRMRPTDRPWATYQAQVAGLDLPPGGGMLEYKLSAEGYTVDFDGFGLRGHPPVQVYLDAKDGYWSTFRPGTEGAVNTGSVGKLLKQAERQLAVVPEGATVEWHFSNPFAAEYMRKVFALEDIPIDVYYTPKVR